MSKIKTFLLNPFSKKRKWWVNILILLIIIIPWVIIGGIFLFKGIIPKKIFLTAVDGMKEATDKQIEEYKKTDTKLEKKQALLVKEAQKLRKKAADKDDQTTKIIKEIDQAASSSNPIAKLDNIRDKLNKIK